MPIHQVRQPGTLPTERDTVDTMRIKHNARQLNSRTAQNEAAGSPIPHAAALYEAARQCAPGSNEAKWFELRALHAAGDTESWRREQLSASVVVDGSNEAAAA